MDHIYKNIEQYNPNKKQKILITFYDMIADMLNNKKLNLIVTELFIRGKKLNISLVFIIRGRKLNISLDFIIRGRELNTYLVFIFRGREVNNYLVFIIRGIELNIFLVFIT